ncbi:vitelline envelope sperm lysin receptor-like [Liolophura sinensis]|uniref:vitelline envelope sperm lysin receptor-like n=1 Tax=Liolophura sinensis TaxID=3198878 RepID=UPI003158DE15
MRILFVVTPSCPSYPYGPDTTFKLLADVPAYATATCKGNYKYDFREVGDGISFTLKVGFDERLAHKQCVFQKKVSTNTFVVLIEVGWGEPGGFILTHKEQYQVSCAYGGKGTGKSLDKPVDDWLIAPKEKQYLLGKEVSSTFTLRVINVHGDPFFHELPLGRWMQLEAISNGKSGEKGIRVLSCVAANSVTSYAILRAGCGDGIVFEKNAGFETRGLRVFSPYFEGFKLKGSNQLMFVCNITVCDHNCNGNSCPVEVKRSIPEKTEVIQIVGDVDVTDEPELVLVGSLLTPPSSTPARSGGQTILVEEQIHPDAKESTRSPLIILWFTAVLTAAVILLVFSTLLQVCVHVKDDTLQPQPKSP